MPEPLTTLVIAIFSGTGGVVLTALIRFRSDAQKSKADVADILTGTALGLLTPLQTEVDSLRNKLIEAQEHADRIAGSCRLVPPCPGHRSPPSNRT